MVSSDWLKKTELFENLEKYQLDLLMSQARIDTYPEGKTIFSQGEEASHLYILIDGVIDLTVKTEEKNPLMSSKIQKEGSVFGLPCLMEPFRYNVSAICLKTSKVLSIKASYIKTSMIQDPKMGMAIMQRIASIYFNRLNEMRQGVSNLIRALKSKPS